jgi:predicted short-subunit dehydrogenase-like oxidoreductase (DUF2520 family)
MHTTDWSRAPIGIAGGGRVGQAIGRILREAGEPVVCVASRSSGHARLAAEFIGAQVEAVTYAELPARASRLLISVPDEALESVAGALELEAGIVLHTCGARGPDALERLRGRGVSCGTLHPLQTIPDAAAGVAALRGAAFAVSGDDEAVAWAERIAALAGGEILRIATGSTALYHAAAVMASNYVTALLAAAQSLLAAAGVEAPRAWRALAPLARASVENTLLLGPVEALTGPIQRGDAATVAAHVSALASVGEPIPMLYRAAGLQALEIAAQRGLPAGRASAIRQILR